MNYWPLFTAVCVVLGLATCAWAIVELRRRERARLKIGQGLFTEVVPGYSVALTARLGGDGYDVEGGDWAGQHHMFSPHGPIPDPREALEIYDMAVAELTKPATNAKLRLGWRP